MDTFKNISAIVLGFVIIFGFVWLSTFQFMEYVGYALILIFALIAVIGVSWYVGFLLLMLMGRD